MHLDKKILLIQNLPPISYGIYNFDLLLRQFYVITELQVGHGTHGLCPMCIEDLVYG